MTEDCIQKNNCTTEEALLDVMTGKDRIHVIKWICYENRADDTNRQDYGNTHEEKTAYSALCSDGVFSSESYGLSDMQIQPSALIVDATHEIWIEGHRGYETWTNANGIKREFQMDDVSYSIDDREILHETEEPIPMTSDLCQDGFWYYSNTTAGYELVDFCIQHPNILELDVHDCFDNFKKLQEAVEKTEKIDNLNQNKQEQGHSDNQDIHNKTEDKIKSKGDLAESVLHIEDEQSEEKTKSPAD